MDAWLSFSWERTQPGEGLADTSVMGDKLAFNDTSTSNATAHADKFAELKPKPKPLGAKQTAEVGLAAVGTKGASKLDNGVGGTVATGEGGFSRRMLQETNGAANQLQGWEDKQLRNVLPWIDMARWQFRQRVREHQEQLDRKSGTFLGLTRGSEMADNTYAAAAAFCEQHATQIQSDIDDEQTKFVAYNAWVPLANGYFGSLMRLRAQEKMLGVTDTAALAQQLMKGIGDMSEVATRMQLANDKGSPITLRIPPADGALAQAGSKTVVAGKKMRTAYFGFQQTLLAVEKDETHHEGDKDQKQLDQINTNKEFVRNAGTVVDKAMSSLDGAPGAVATATTKMNQIGAHLGAAANKRQIMKGMRQTHNPTYIATDAHGNMVVRNVQTATDRAMTTKPGEPYAQTPTPESEGPTLPTGVSDLLGKIVDFAYASEVHDINFRLEQIKTRCEIIQSVSDAIATKQKIQSFQDALNEFADQCNDLQRRMEERRQQYLEFGVQLDNFARTDHGSQKAGLSPSKGGERYATIMTVVSTVREVLTLGHNASNSAISGDFSTPQLREWAEGLVERRERNDDGRRDISQLYMPGAELQRMTDMYEQVKHFEGDFAQQKARFGALDVATGEALGAHHQGSGSTSGGIY